MNLYLIQRCCQDLKTNSSLMQYISTMYGHGKCEFEEDEFLELVDKQQQQLSEIRSLING